MTTKTIHISDQGPWGKPRSGGNGGGWKPDGQSPKGSNSDIEELLNDLKKKLNDMFGGHHNNRGIIAAVVLFFCLWLASGIYQLQPGEQGVVMRFGKFNRLATSGLRYHLPAPFE